MPIDPGSLVIYIPIALALNLTPGADMLFCLGQGLRAGPRAGLASSLGIATGSFIHSVLAGLGLAALIASSPILFEIIRWGGVCYLLWLAYSSLVTSAGVVAAVDRETMNPVSPERSVASESAFIAWRKGILVCLLNPKVALFILALVPQFVDPERGSVLAQFLIYGLILNIGGTIINGFVGFFAGTMGNYLSRNQLTTRMFQYLTGFVFLGLAAKLALERR